MKMKVELGTPVILGNMLLVPIMGENIIEAIPLDEGYERGVEVLETDVIDRVVLNNPTEDHIFVMDGEEFLGARQDRVAVASALIESECSVEYPVVCIERKRWEEGEKRFKLGFSAFPRLRETLTFERKDKFNVNQEKVWYQVESKLTSLSVKSQTLSMHDSFEERHEDIEGYLSWEPDDETVGVMAFSNRGFLCCDIFGSQKIFKKLKNKLLSGYALDALEDRFKGKSFNIETIRPDLILADIKNCEKEREMKSIGIGTEDIVRGERVKGKILHNREELIHASFFPSVK